MSNSSFPPEKVEKNMIFYVRGLKIYVIQATCFVDLFLRPTRPHLRCFHICGLDLGSRGYWNKIKWEKT